MDNDHQGLVLFFVAVFVCIAMSIGSYKAGKDAERERLYNKCIDQNSQLIYNKAIETCKKAIE